MMKQLLHYMVIILVGWQSSRYIEWPMLQKSFSNHWKLRAGLSWEGVCCCGWCVKLSHFKSNRTVCLQSPLHLPTQQQHLIWWPLLVIISKTIFTTKKKVKLDCWTEIYPILVLCKLQLSYERIYFHFPCLQLFMLLSM